MVLVAAEVAAQRQQLLERQRVHAMRAAAIQRAEAGGRADSDRHAEPIRDLQVEAVELSRSRLSLDADVEVLRASERRTWRKDYETLVHQIKEADLAWQAEVLKTRREEETERRRHAREAPNIGLLLTRREAEWGLGRRIERRRRRDLDEPRPWADDHAADGRPSSTPSAPRRPRTAPAREPASECARY